MGGLKWHCRASFCKSHYHCTHSNHPGHEINSKSCCDCSHTLAHTATLAAQPHQRAPRLSVQHAWPTRVTWKVIASFCNCAYPIWVAFGFIIFAFLSGVSICIFNISANGKFPPAEVISPMLPTQKFPPYFSVERATRSATVDPSMPAQQEHHTQYAEPGQDRPTS